MHPACPNQKQNHLQNSLLRQTQFWVRKTFSKPASLKRASLVPQPTPGKRQKHGLRKLDRGQICSSHLVSRHNSYQGTSTKFRTRNTRTHAWPSPHDQRRNADHRRPAFFPSGGRTGQTRFTFPRDMAI